MTVLSLRHSSEAWLFQNLVSNCAVAVKSETRDVSSSPARAQGSHCIVISRTSALGPALLHLDPIDQGLCFPDSQSWWLSLWPGSSFLSSRLTTASSAQTQILLDLPVTEVKQVPTLMLQTENISYSRRGNHFIRP